MVAGSLRSALFAAALSFHDGSDGGGDAPPLRPADLFARTYVGSVALAPDGRHALVFESAGAGGPTRLVELEWGLRGANRSEHELPADAWGHVTFDPASGAALFLRGAPPTSELWQVEAGGEPRRVLPPGDSSGVFELFHQAGPPGDPKAGAGRWLLLSNTTSGPREALLAAVDVEKGELGEELARFGTLAIREAVLAPDGRTLALIGTEEPTFAAEGEPLDLWLFDLATKKRRRVTHGALQLARPVFTPDSSALVCAWQAAANSLSSAKRDLALVDLESGRGTRLTADLPVSIGNGIFGADEPIVFVDERTLLVATQHGLADDLLEVTLPPRGVPAAGGAPPGVNVGLTRWRWRTEGREAWSRLSASPAAGKLLAVESAPSRPERVGLIEWPAFDVKVVEDANAELAGRELARSSVVAFRGADGLALEGVLLEPAHAPPPHPTIVVLHGGSGGRSTLRFNDNLMQAWAALGYAVFAPNLRGSAGYGVDFSRLNEGDVGGRELADLDAAADALVERGTADRTRLFVMGHSYGGYLAEMAAIRSRKFRAACAAAGVSDWRSFYAGSDLAALAVLGLGGTPDEKPELYRERSPLALVDAATAPLLLVHGERDRRVPVDQSERLFAAATRAGCRCELLSLPGVGHVIGGRENVEKWLAAGDRWFRKAAETPRPAESGAPPSGGR
jgi:dipeptidyl aminopeptidase/acylaminoacyl peptidase